MSAKVTVSSRVPHFTRVPHFSPLLREVGPPAQFLLPRILSPTHKWMTAHQPPQTHQPAPNRPIPLHRLDRVFRASGNIPARRQKQRRDRPLITSQQEQHKQFGDFLHSTILSSK